MSYFETIQTRFADSSSVDAFGRARVSNSSLLFDGKILTAEGGSAFEDAEITGSGTSVNFDVNSTEFTLGVAATTAGRRLRQSTVRRPYFPGKSQFTLIAFILGAVNSGITKGVGLYDDDDGVFLRSNGTTIQIVRRSSVTGTPIDDPIPQASWNLDKFDGFGPSGVDLDFKKLQALVIDFTWVGGRIRCGFEIDGQTVYFHEFLSTNVLFAPFVSNPHLPIRFEIENDGSGPVDSLGCFSSAILAEGGIEDVGSLFGIASSVETATLAPAATYAVLGVRLKAAFVRKAIVRLTNLAVMGTTANDTFILEIWVNPVIAGSPVFVSVDPNSAVDWFEGGAANTITGGTLVSATASISRAGAFGAAGRVQQLFAAIDDTPAELIIAVRPFSTIQVSASINWSEDK